MEREREVHRLLTRERILGLDLLKGRRGPGGAETSAPPEEPAKVESGPETEGLPLFGRDGEESGDVNHKGMEEDT